MPEEGKGSGKAVLGGVEPPGGREIENSSSQAPSSSAPAPPILHRGSMARFLGPLALGGAAVAAAMSSVASARLSSSRIAKAHAATPFAVEDVHHATSDSESFALMAQFLILMGALTLAKSTVRRRANRRSKSSSTTKSPTSSGPDSMGSGLSSHDADSQSLKSKNGTGLKTMPAWLWWTEATIYAYLVVQFYMRTLMTTERVSARYKELLVNKHHQKPHVSGLHDSWLSPWIGGRPIDIKDAQYHEFRDMLPTLVGIMVVYLLLGFVVRRLTLYWSRLNRMRARATYIASVGILASVVFHEADTIKILVLVALNQVLSHATLSTHWITPTIMWAFNILVLYCNETYSGYKFSSIFGKTPWTHWLDSHTGDLQWHHSFNFIMLRMVSFNMDMWWRYCAIHTNTDPTSKDAKHSSAPSGGASASKIWKSDDDTVAIRESSIDERSRVEQYHLEQVYHDPVVYLSYLLYLPLYVAGPTITFNSFVSHLALAQQTYTLKGKFRYAFRFLAILLLFEVLTHYLYVGTLSFMAFRYTVNEVDPTTRRFVRTPLLVYLTRQYYGGPLNYEDVIYYSYWALMYLWFKFLLIWRFFRLWAVCDDIEPVENMERCMNNNFTIGGFWRAWHRSFNRWLVRYIYVPLGGNGIGPFRKAFNILVVFTFVGFWHDIKPQLFAWGWLLSIFFVPEIVAERVSRFPAMRSWMDMHPLASRWLVCFLGACNIIMLKIANIVGYTTGLEGAALLLPAITTWEGAFFVLYYLFVMATGVHLMFFIREWRGQDLNATSKRI